MTGQPIAQTMGTAREVTPEEHAENFKAYQQSEDYDPLKYGDGRLMDAQVITKSSDGLEWSTPGEAEDNVADISLMMSTGWTPRINILDTVDAHV